MFHEACLATTYSGPFMRLKGCKTLKYIPLLLEMYSLYCL